jgi:predicted signal transduction protein with EAL and GGDEF domain
MAAPFEIDNHPIHISTSVGIALCPDYGSSPQELLKKADLALYAAKASGRNCFRLYQPAMLQAVEGEKELEAELRGALARDEFELHYQPILDAETRTVCAAEALVRWRHPERGLIPPAHFIPVAEQSGLILPLGEWIIAQACRDAASWPSHIRLAINVSAIQFRRGNLFEVVMEALLQSGLSPRRLEIEVTETALLDHRSEHLHDFRRLKDIGVELVLDDFGTGYSSASYVTNFPFDKIKIDKSFVQGFDTRRECAAVIASAVALAKGLDITITAEGIENESQFAALRATDVDFMQGYLFGRPAPYDVFVQGLNMEPLPDDVRTTPATAARTGKRRKT